MPRSNTSAIAQISQIPEEYRTLRINLDFHIAGKGIQTIGVLSVKRGEGRTTTAHQLAMAYAASGKTTLLVDADLRSPSIHKSFGRNTAYGLGGYLSEPSSWSETVEITPFERLSVMKAGPTQASPSELLTSEPMKQLLSELKGQYDRIIIDCPPLQYIDARVLAAMCDGAVLVSEYGKVSRDEAKKVAGELASMQVNLLGTLLNKHLSKAARE